MDSVNKISPFLNQVLQGDSLKLLKKLPAKSVDLIFADPPYNLQLQQELFRPDLTKVCAVNDDWDKFSSFKEYDDFSKAWLTECKRILKPTASLWLIGSYHNIFRLGASLQNLDFWILNDIVWIKTNPMPNFRGTRFNNAHETLIWAVKSKKAKFTFNYKTMKSFNEDKQMRSDWFLPICSGKERLKDKQGNKAHSTQKPEELLKRVILSSSKEADLILDPFFGSGTTGVVAKRFNRHFIGFEKEKKYVDIAKKRIENTTAYSPSLTFQLQETPKPKVPFGQIVGSYIKVGEKLYSKDKSQWARVMADGTLKSNKYSGSIHALSAKMLKIEKHNGWNFWYVQKKGKLISINAYREKYFKKLVS